MLKPSINDVLNKIDNRYYLVGTVSKRSREIITETIEHGEANLYIRNTDRDNKPVSLATKEVAQGKIGYRLLTEEEIQIQEDQRKEEQANQIKEAQQ